MFKMKKNQKGFTLIEVLLVVVILGILAAVALPRFMSTRDDAQLKTCQSNLAAINTAVEEYLFMNNIKTSPTDGVIDLVGSPAYTAPYNLVDIYDSVTGLGSFPDGAPECPVSGATYSLLATGRSTCITHGTL